MDLKSILNFRYSLDSNKDNIIQLAAFILSIYKGELREHYMNKYMRMIFCHKCHIFICIKMFEIFQDI